MTLRSGTREVGPADGTLLIRTGREGAAAKMGHDLSIVATAWSATVTVVAEQPDRSSVRATIDAASLTVREGRGGATALTTKQQSDIEKTIRDKVLESDRHPQITFVSTAVGGTVALPTVTGDLTIAGTTRSVSLRLAVHDGEGGVRVSGSTQIVQSDFGIKPYSALLGTLRVRDTVDLEVDITLPG